MKKQIIILACIFPILSFSQVIFTSDFEDWSGNIPANWNGTHTNIGAGNFTQYSTSAAFGNYACQLINTGTTHKRFTTTAMQITNGQTYSISFWVRGKGDIRMGLYNGIDANQNTYASYINVNSNTWTKYSQQLVANATSSNAEFIISVRNTDPALEHLQVDSVTIRIASTSIDTVPIYQIQYTTQQNGNSPYVDQVIVTYGTVTAVKSGHGFFIQDGTGPWSGLYIYNNTYTVQPGDSIVLLGKIVEYYGWTEMTQVSSLTIIGQTTIPAPTTILTGQVNSEDFESVLVKVENAQCTNTNAGYGMWVVNDGSGFAKIDDFLFSFVPSLNQIYTIVGPIRYSFNEFRISPRSGIDITQTTHLPFENEELLVIGTNNYNMLYVQAGIPVQITFFNISGKLLYNTTSPSTYQTFSVKNLSKGVYFIQIISNDGTINEIRKIYIE